MRAPEHYTFDDLAQLPDEGAAPAPAAPAKSDWKTTAKEIFEAGKTAYKSFRASKKTPRAAAPVAPAYYPAPQAPMLSEGWDTNKILMIAGGGLALIGVIYFLTRR